MVIRTTCAFVNMCIDSNAGEPNNDNNDNNDNNNNNNNNNYYLRGHLKSSHIADKRKNFHMALYPLPPPPPVLKRKCDRQWEKCMADVQIYFKDCL